MKLEVIEWSVEDSTGYREYLGKHLYDEATMLRVVRKGGAIETDHMIYTEKEILAIFNF